jgi:hypothetical protein
MPTQFPAYRQYNATRSKINDSVIALLLATRLAQEHIRENSDPSERLAARFSAIPGIDRLNLTIDHAGKILGEAENDLAYMAISQVLGGHNAFITELLEILKLDNIHEPFHDVREIKLETGHELIQVATGQILDKDELALFHLIRKIRNRIIHNDGTLGSYIASEYRHLNKNAKDRWERITSKPLDSISVDGRIALTESEIFATLSICTSLARQLNEAVASTISSGTLADIVVEDYKVTYPDRFKQKDRRAKRVATFSKDNYSSRLLSADEIESAIERVGK